MKIYTKLVKGDKLKYKLIENSKNDINNITETIFLNRGITNYKSFIDLDKNSICDYSLLNNIKEAVECYIKHINNKSKIKIVVDPDVDGFVSASLIYKYTKLIDNSSNISYTLHTKKQHGLTDDIIIEEDIDLLIVPDAGSNDIEKCKYYKNKNIDIIILDHHICDLENNYAIVVNNQKSEKYLNKQLCGAGVVYKFLQALDEELWNDYSNNFIDLVSLALIADNMDVKSLETRYLIDLGLLKIRNKLFKALINKQAYSLGEDFSSKDIQFLIVPLINALIRVGDYDEKDLLFKCFIEVDETFKYKKRGSVDLVDESIYDRVARLCVNAKSKQNKIIEKSFFEIVNEIKDKKLNDNKVIFCDITKILNDTLTGIVAIKVSEYFKKPILLLRKKMSNDNLYGGSLRNFDGSPIESLKNFLDDLNQFEYVRGHDNAAGFEIHKDRIKDTIKLINQKLENVYFTKCTSVDFIIDSNELDIRLIKIIDELKYYCGTGFNDIILAIANIQISKNDLILMGENKNHWKFSNQNGIDIIKFKANEEDEILNWYNGSGNNLIGLNVVGKCNINNYKGILKCQFIINDYDTFYISQDNIENNILDWE